jgi:hypothetical protein
VAIVTYYAFSEEIGTPPPEGHLGYGTMPDVNWKMGDTLLGRAGFGVEVFKAVKGQRTTAIIVFALPP